MDIQSSLSALPGDQDEVTGQSTKIHLCGSRRGKDNSKMWSTPKDLGISTCCVGPFLAQSAKIFETTQPWALALERSEFFVADNRLSTFSWVQLHQHLAEASADFVLIFCTVFLLISRHFLWGSKIFLFNTDIPCHNSDEEPWYDIPKVFILALLSPVTVGKSSSLFY